MDKIAAYIGCFWLFVVLDSFFIWNPFENLITICAHVGVLWVSYFYIINQRISINGKTFSTLLSVGLVFLWMLFIYSGNIYGFVLHVVSLLALLSIMTWPVDQYGKIYILFRKAIIFFAAGSTFVSLLTATGLINFIPYFELPPRSPLHESLGIVYHVYFFFVTNFGDMEFFPRACGMLQEPGHFAIILGFVYMADRLLGNKVSVWVVLCGFLTFSSNFPIIMLIAEIYNLFNFKYFFKIVKWVGVSIIAGFVIFNYLSRDLQDTIKYLAYERNLEMVIDAFAASGSLTEALDERTSDSGDVAFQNIDSSNMWVGLGHDETLITLSDYRGVILQYGVIGLILIIIAILSVTRKYPKRAQIQVLAFLFLVLIQRSWMFYASYLYFLPFMCSILYCERTLNLEYDE